MEKASLKKNIDTKKFVDDMSQNFKDLIPYLGCEIDDFIRTTEKRHYKSVQNLWNILEKKNEIYLSKYSGWYSVSDEAFYSDNEIKEENGINISTISGSKAALLISVSPFANIAAIIAFSVAPTEILGKSICCLLSFFHYF